MRTELRDRITNESYGPYCEGCGGELENGECRDCTLDVYSHADRFVVDSLGRLVGPCPTCDGETLDTSGGPCAVCLAEEQGLDEAREVIEWVHAEFLKLLKEEFGLA